MEHRHREVDDVIGADLEPLGEHRATRREGALRATDRFGITGGAGGEDQHHQVVGRDVTGVDERLGRRVDQIGPLLCVGVDDADPGQRHVVEQMPGGGVGEHHLTVGARDIGGQRLPASRRVESDHDECAESGRAQQHAEFECVLHQHTDVRRAIVVEQAAQRGAPRGRRCQMVAPGEAPLTVVDTAISNGPQ